jgi:hypothetical protein
MSSLSMCCVVWQAKSQQIRAVFASHNLLDEFDYWCASVAMQHQQVLTDFAYWAALQPAALPNMCCGAQQCSCAVALARLFWGHLAA